MPTRATRALVLLSCLVLVGAWPPSRLAAQGGAASPVAPDSSRLVGAFYPSPSAQRKGWLRLAGWTARMEAAERERVGSAPALLVLLTVRDSTLAEGERQYAYFDLRRSRDIRDAEAAAWLDSVDRVTGEAAAASSAVVSALPEATLSRWLVQSSALSRYAFALREDRRSSSRLPSREDKLVRTVAPLLTDWQSDLYQLLIDRTDFGEVRRGERSLDVWRQRGAIASDSDRSVRQEGFERLRAGFARSRDLFAFALIAAVKGRQQLALLQGEPSAPAQVYRSRYLEESSVRTLLDGIRGRAGMLRQYARDRAEFVQRVGGYPDLRPWDLNAPVGMVTPRFPLDTARSLMREALRPLGPEYSAELDSLLDSAAGRLDVASGPHRADGGHSVGFPGTPVGVYLFGYDGLYADLGRLVHESAHAMQKRLMARGGVLPTYANGPNYLAESVALFNELVVADYLASTRGSDPRARQFYLERFLAKAFEVVLGAQDADLEQTIYDSVTAGRVATADDLDSLTDRVMSAYSIGPQRREQWMYARLLYVDPLYHVNYMYSGMIALSLFQQYRADPAGFARRYGEFLERGYVAPPVDLLRRLGIDPGDPDLLTSDFELLGERLNEVERLQAENARTATPGGPG